MNKSLFSFNNIIIYLYIMIVPLHISVFQRYIGGEYITFLIFIFVIFFVIFRNKLKIDKSILSTTFLYAAPFFVSMILVFYSLINIDPHQEYYNYFILHFPNRTSNFFINVIVFLWFSHKVCSDKKGQFTDMVLIIYYIVLSIILVIGVWQMLSHFLGVTFLPFKVRDYVHSVDSSVVFFNWRLTSIAREPSWFVPFILEHILLTVILIKRISSKILIIFIGFVLLLFTFTGSAVIEILFMLFGLLLLLKLKDIKVLFCCFGFFLTSSLLLFAPYINKVFNTITYRILNFSPYNEPRVYILISILPISLRDGVINFLFGHGPNSFKFLGQVERYPLQSLRFGELIEPGSNNYFVDSLYELGVFGLILYLVLFFKEIIYFFKKRYLNKYFMVGFLMSLHFFASALYRADYVSPRFFVILIILYILKRKGTDFYEKNTASR